MATTRQPQSTLSRIAALETGMVALTTSVDHLRDAVERLVSRGTDWGVLGTWSAIMVTVIGGLGVLALQPIRAAQVTNDSIHVALDARLLSYEQRITRVEAQLDGKP